MVERAYSLSLKIVFKNGEIINITGTNEAVKENYDMIQSSMGRKGQLFKSSKSEKELMSFLIDEVQLINLKERK